MRFVTQGHRRTGWRDEYLATTQSALCDRSQQVYALALSVPPNSVPGPETETSWARTVPFIVVHGEAAQGSARHCKPLNATSMKFCCLFEFSVTFLSSVFITFSKI